MHQHIHTSGKKPCRWNTDFKFWDREWGI